MHDASEGFFYMRRSGGFYIHPSVGKGRPGVYLMLHPGGTADAFKGELEYAQCLPFSSA